jgi:uncharacterized protein YjcR
MAEDRKRSGGPRGVNWIAVRTAYVVRGYTSQQCADEFGIDVTTVKKRASKEGWTQERHRNATQGAEVVSEAMKAAVTAHMGGQAARVQRALDLQDAIQAKIGTLIDAIDLTKPAQLRSIVEMNRTSVESLTRLVESDRLVRGITTGKPSDGEVEQADDAFTFTIDEEALAEAKRLA